MQLSYTNTLYEKLKVNPNLSLNISTLYGLDPLDFITTTIRFGKLSRNFCQQSFGIILFHASFRTFHSLSVDVGYFCFFLPIQVILYNLIRVPSAHFRCIVKNIIA